MFHPGQQSNSVAPPPFPAGGFPQPPAPFPGTAQLQQPHQQQQQLPGQPPFPGQQQQQQQFTGQPPQFPGQTLQQPPFPAQFPGPPQQPQFAPPSPGQFAPPPPPQQFPPHPQQLPQKLPQAPSQTQQLPQPLQQPSFQQPGPPVPQFPAQPFPGAPAQNPGPPAQPQFAQNQGFAPPPGPPNFQPGPNSFNPPQPTFLNGNTPQNHVQQQPQPMQQQAGFPGMPSAPGGAPFGAAPGPPQQDRRYVDLCLERNILGYPFDDNNMVLPNSVCNPEARMDPKVFRCTVSAIPETQELLKKTRIPLGLTLHPFRDLKHLTVMQTNIVRCRYCRTYINPYVALPDHRHWKCNLCFRANELPDDFLFDPVEKQYGDPRNRPELNCTTVEYIAPNEYMLRPPQQAVYFFVFDVSAAAVDSGYLLTFSEQLLLNLDRIPGDDRTLIGFLAVDSCLHFFEFFAPQLPPRELIVTEIDEPFVPVPTGILTELREFKETVRAFVNRIPTIFEHPLSRENCMGTALATAHQLLAPIGGRISLFTCSRPSLGQGTLRPLDPQAVDQKLTPTSDFYKRMALDCTTQQISVDLFALNTEYSDVATMADAVKFSSGTVYHFNSFHLTRTPLEALRFKKLFGRYLARKIGFEAVLRIRCSKGLSLHTFHGNFFVRSTDLLTLANVNPDSALGVQIQYEEDLHNQAAACFQAALLYTSSKGDRRIRVHTMCVPVTRDVPNIFGSFDTKASISLLAKMAVERSLTGAGGQDIREALINSAVDTLAAYNRSIGLRPAALCAPIYGQMKFYPLFVLGMLKHAAFNGKKRMNRDELAAALLFIKSAPLEAVLNEVYPLLFPLHQLDQSAEVQRLGLSYERVNKDGVYLMDAGKLLLIYVCSHCRPEHLQNLFGVATYGQLNEDAPFEQLPNEHSDRVHALIRALSQERCHFAPVVVCREDGQRRDWFTSRLVEDRSESAHSYVEFLQHLTREIQR